MYLTHVEQNKERKRQKDYAFPFGFADRIDIAKICSGLEMQLRRIASCHRQLYDIVYVYGLQEPSAFLRI